MCDKLEDECELYIAKDFQKAKQKLGADVYSVKMTKIKLEKDIETSICKYRRKKWYHIILDNISVILTESLYDKRKSNQCDEIY